MGARRKARELALKTLFESDFNELPLAKIADRVQIEEEVEAESAAFMQLLLSLYESNKEKINRRIEEHSNNWKLSRMANVDRNILRLGVTEIIFCADIPKNVTINECLEIAKKFGTEESSSFVNGILDKIEKAVDSPK